MFFIAEPTVTPFWQFVYVAYICWVTGLMSFGVLVSYTYGNSRLAHNFLQSRVGILAATWMLASILTAGYMPIMLIAGPFMIIGLGAPLGAGIVCLAYLVFATIITGMALSEGPKMAHAYH